MRALTAVLAWLALGCAAQAHGGGEASGEPLSWTFDPLVVTPLAITAIVYAAGVTRLWRSAGIGRGIRGWRVGCYFAGWLSLALALCSPLHWAGERLFTFHMIEHEIVMAISAPLIAVARPLGAFFWALPRALRGRVAGLGRLPAARRFWSFLVAPRVATIMHGAVIWAWHAPALLDASVAHLGVHRLQHLSFLLTALQFWWALLRRASAGAAAGHVFLTMLHTGLLGALIALSPRVLYPVQTRDAAEWGLTPLEDQQLAGLLMWVPAGTIYAASALAFAALWIRGSDRGSRNEGAYRGV